MEGTQAEWPFEPADPGADAAIRRPVRIVGQPGTRAELVAQAVRDAGVPILVGDERPDARCVTLLVEPTRLHWADARTAAARGQGGLVLVAEPAAGDADAVAAMLLGADAVVEADAGAAEIVHALEVVARGGALVPARRLRLLLHQARALAAGRIPPQPVRLTPREVDILHSIDAGHSVKQTATALGISAKTVENLQSRMFRKLDARNRAQAVTKAAALGLLQREAC